MTTKTRSYAYDTMTSDDIVDYLRTSFDWSNTKQDLVDRVIRNIAWQCDTIEKCTGSLLRAQQITWCGIFIDSPFEANCFRFDPGGWACDDESILAIRV